MKYQCSTKFLSLLACGTLQMGMIPGLAAEKSELLKIHDTLSNHENRISHLENSTESSSRNSATDKKLSVNLKNAVSSNTTAASIPSTYRVQDGDTATKIAAKKNVKLSALLAANGLSSTSVLRIGQSLKIPGASTTQSKSGSAKTVANVTKTTGKTQATPSRKESIKVSTKDTLYSLARKYETTVDAIKALNPGIEETKLRPGSELLVPVKTTKSVPVATGQAKPVKSLAPAINMELPGAQELHPAPHPSKPTQAATNPVVPQQPATPRTTVPEKSSTVTTKAADLYGTQEYQTVAGESWQTVARDFGTTVDVLRHYNGAVSGTELAPGTFLRVPASKYENSADLR